MVSASHTGNKVSKIMTLFANLLPQSRNPLWSLNDSRAQRMARNSLPQASVPYIKKWTINLWMLGSYFQESFNQYIPHFPTTAQIPWLISMKLHQKIYLRIFALESVPIQWLFCRVASFNKFCEGYDILTMLRLTFEARTEPRCHLQGM